MSSSAGVSNFTPYSLAQATCNTTTAHPQSYGPSADINLRVHKLCISPCSAWTSRWLCALRCIALGQQLITSRLTHTWFTPRRTAAFQPQLAQSPASWLTGIRIRAAGQTQAHDSVKIRGVGWQYMEAISPLNLLRALMTCAAGPPLPVQSLAVPQRLALSDLHQQPALPRPHCSSAFPCPLAAALQALNLTLNQQQQLVLEWLWQEGQLPSPL
jgi:hypothetical protein